MVAGLADPFARERPRDRIRDRLNNNNNNNSAYSPTSRFHFEGRFSIGLYTKFFGGVSLSLVYFPLPVNPPYEFRMLHFVEYRRRGN